MFEMRRTGIDGGRACPRQLGRDVQLFEGLWIDAFQQART